MRLDFSDAVPPTLDRSSPVTDLWRDVTGREWAYGQLVGNYYWMRVPGVGSYRLGDGERATIVVPDDGANPLQVVDIYYRSVLPLLLHLRGREVLHASAVTLPQGVVALCARPETGKSTLAYALQNRGHALFADDAVVFEIADGRPALKQVPFAVRLRKPSAVFFGARSRDQVRITGSPPPLTDVDLPFTAVCVLERLVGDDAEPDVDGHPPRSAAVSVRRLPQSDAFTAVTSHGYCFSLRDQPRIAAMVKSYLSLVANVPVFKVEYLTGLEHLPQILKALEEAVVSVSDARAA